MRLTSLRISFLALLLCLTPRFVPLYAQFNGKSFVINFSKKAYNGGNQNWSVDIDSTGMTYIGNNQGLLRFDGSNWDLFHMPDNMVVRSVAVAPDNRIYVGGFEEFGFFSLNSGGFLDYTSLSTSTVKENFHNDEIWRIVIHQGKVYFQSFSHIYVYDGKSVNVLDPGGTIVLLLEARERLFVHRVGEGLFEIRSDSLHFIQGSSFLANDEVKMILPYKTHDFLVGASSGGLYVMDEKGFHPLDKPVNRMIKDAEVNNGIVVGNFLVIGTIVNGIYILNSDGSLREHLNTDNFLQNNTVLALKTGNAGSFWAGLDRGLDYVSLNNPLSFYMDPSRSRRTVFTAALTGDTLWVGTNQGVFRYEHNPSMGYLNPVFVEGTQGQVWDLSVIDGELFCGHTNGTFLIRSGKPERISDVNGGYEIRKIEANGHDILLQSSYSVFSVYTRSENGWKFSRVIPGFYEPVPHFEPDHYGYIWASHASKGLYRLRFDPGYTRVEAVRYFGQRDGFPTERNIQVAKVDNRVIFCTRKRIYTYNDLSDSIVPYTSLNQQLGEYSASGNIISVANDKYWCIAGNKAAFFRISNGRAVKLFSYDLSRQGAYFGTGHSDVSILKNNLYLLCLDNGFALYSESDSVFTYPQARPLIRMVRAFDRKKRTWLAEVNPGKAVMELPYAYRNLDISFSADQIFASPAFSYRLGTIDNQWSEWSEKSQVTFTRLPSGEYRFMLRTLKLDGSISPTVALGIKIRRPWYASIAALLIYGAFLFAIIIILRVLFVRRLKAHAARMQTLEKEKRQRVKLMADQEMIRLKNEKLQSEVSHKNIQLANYTMTILKKNELLIKLKDEITGQKKDLGGRYPNYHYDRLISMIDSNLSSEDDWKIFEMHFDQAHENFFMRLKSNYPELTPSDMKLCAYLRLNLSSKEIAPLLNISVRGVEIRRYRLRKRLFLNTEDNLIEFLMNF